MLFFNTNTLFLYPSNALSSNIFALSGIAIYKGANGQLSISNSQAAASGTNQLIQTNGVNLGSAGTVNWASGVTGFLAGVVANLGVSASGGSSITTNGNQFLGVPLSIKDGALVTNLVTRGLTNNGAFSNSSSAFFGGFTDATGPNTNRTQLNLPHLTVSRSAIINGQGDLTNSTAASNWSLYDTNIWNARQGGSSVLTNLIGTGVLTNIVNGSSNWPAGQVGLLGPTNNGDVRIKSLSQGANITLTDQTTNIQIAVSGVVTSITTNANQFGAQVTLTIKDSPYITNLTDFATSRVDSIIASNTAYAVKGAISNLFTTNATVRAGVSSSNAQVGGLIWFDTSSYTNCCAGAVLTNMDQFTVPAHVLTNSGDSLRWWIAGKMAPALASTNEIAIIYGSQTVLDTGLQIASNRQWTATGTITRTGNTSQRIEATFWWPGDGSAFTFTNTVGDIAQTNGIDTVFKVQGASRRVSVLTNMLLKIAYEPALK